MQSTENDPEYIVSIRIPFPKDISDVLMREKNRFVSEYRSGYKSEPHITLYLARYTEEGLSKLPHDLRGLLLKPFQISLLTPKVVTEEKVHRNLYILDVSNKEQLQKLHVEVLDVAVQYRSPLLRDKIQKRLEQGLYSDSEQDNLHKYGSASVLQLFDPHITLGEIGADDPQPDPAKVQKNLESVIGKEIIVSELAVFFHKRESNDEKAKLVEEVAIPF